MGEAAARRRIVVTGAGGFVGKNLLLRLTEHAEFEPVPLVRGATDREWDSAIAAADAVVHLAGVNRPSDEAEFAGNVELARRVADSVRAAGRAIPVLHASSSKATDDTPYGRSKAASEEMLFELARDTGAPVAVFRLPNIFGKWCRPGYNSAVATFCHNIVHGLPITVHDPAAPLSLLYVDDLIDCLLDYLRRPFETGFAEAGPVYRTTVGEVADALRGFAAGREQFTIASVGQGLTRALYATYVSYLDPAMFAYPLVSHSDPRGSFSEMLKTEDSGQFSYFTAHPGVTRGGHYHHTKTEKFLIVYGEALFRFRHMLTGETHEVRTSAEVPVVVETIPGWTHDVTNVGETIMVAMLWANEVFDPQRPDTVTARL